MNNEIYQSEKGQREESLPEPGWKFGQTESCDQKELAAGPIQGDITLALAGFKANAEIMPIEGAEGKGRGRVEKEKKEDTAKPDALVLTETDKRVLEQISRFNDCAFPVRKAAKEKLIEIGPEAIPHLVKAREGKHSLEESKNIEETIRGIKNKYEPAAGRQSVKDWLKDAGDKLGTEEPLPPILAGERTPEEGKERAAALKTLAKIEAQLGNPERASQLEGELFSKVVD